MKIFENNLITLIQKCLMVKKKKKKKKKGKACLPSAIILLLKTQKCLVCFNFVFPILMSIFDIISLFPTNIFVMFEFKVCLNFWKAFTRFSSINHILDLFMNRLLMQCLKKWIDFPFIYIFNIMITSSINILTKYDICPPDFLSCLDANFI